MRSDEFISKLAPYFGEDETFEKLRKDLPLGVDSVGNILYARREGNSFSTRHTCVTGSGKSHFIRRLLLTCTCLYERTEASHLILSPHSEYGELLRLGAADFTVPYIRTKSDLEEATKTLKELLTMREYGRGYPRLFLVLDGLESLGGCNRNEDLEEDRELIDLLSRRENVDVITGVDLTKSIFSGYPGAFVGVGNCLIATRESGKADVTYVTDEGSLTLPLPLTYPDAPSLTETVVLFNSVRKKGSL